MVSSLSARAATWEPHLDVQGAEVTAVRVRSASSQGQDTAWDDLESTSVEPGRHAIELHADAGARGDGIRLPHCAGQEKVTLDGHAVQVAAEPPVLPLSPGSHDIEIAVDVSAYERRIACGERPRVGEIRSQRDGLGVLVFASPDASRGGGRALLYVPPRHDIHKPAALLVGLHPWNGSMWTYAAYSQLFVAAAAHDLLLLLPSGLGNSLYTAAAEDEVMRAIAAAEEVVAVDAQAVSIWGASMGGAGATTIGFHHPDRFASVTSFFGDSRYDRSTYVRSILPSDAAAHAVNAFDIADNARSLPVWLVHGEEDRVSPIRQSEWLATALAARGFAVRFDRVPGVGHSGALVARFLNDVVERAARARAVEWPARVTYRSVRPSDTEAYGVRFVRASAEGDAFIDLERRDDGVHVLRAEAVRGIALARGAFGTAAERPPPIVFDRPSRVPVRWDDAP